MAGIFSFFSSAPKENVEAILAELDETIRLAQIRLDEAKQQRDYYSGTLILYMGIGYVAYVAIYALFLRDPFLDTWREAFSKLAPVLLLPVIIYYVRIVCDFYFDKQVSNQSKPT
ncbi:hypothetical protein DSO57_1026691 [Entomophthora muscae]|uniref:Uncharacterized protein n=1 Tax=Entomophthora muscae TaxID=34485 RepID=A0ACC2T218_9FUNG|nr:hypothetical protein DSO57_1026691 [Entomophthora muscae]